jgi:hypothetical protein
VAALLAIQRAGLNEKNRQRLQALLRAKSVRPGDVARVFMIGGSLKPLPPCEAQQVCEYIETEPKIASWLAAVISLYHSDKPLAVELLPVARRTLRAIQEINDGRGNLSYECDRIAIRIARTDINVGFAILEELVDRIFNQDRWRFLTGWNPFDWRGSRNFWEFLRAQQPERAYAILGRLPRRHEWPDFRHHGNRYLLDLSSHGEILRALGQKDLAAAQVFADCAMSTQPGFLPFAADLLELYPNNDEILSSLNSAVLEQSGFGSSYNHLGEAEKFVADQLSSDNVSPNLLRWRTSLTRLIQDRRAEERSFFRSEPSYWET